MSKALSLLILCFTITASHADAGDSARAHYLANAGVMIAHGGTKVMFDPFFRNGYNVYDLMPAKMEADMFAGSQPWDGIDAIFISHYHGDHFDPAIVLEYLSLWQDVHLYAPAQATDALLALVADPETSLLERVHSVSLQHDSEPVRFVLRDIDVEAVRIAHGGWPKRHSEVHNIAFRVTLHGSTTVIHLGDADKAEQHYEPHEGFWAEREIDLALPPVWLFFTDEGRHALKEYVNAQHAIGVHVYSSIADAPSARPAEYQGLDVFTQPGETRQLQD